MHQQPSWPFPVRPSLMIVTEDPAFRAEVLGAVAALAGAGLLLGAALVGRRFRVAAALVAAGIAWFAVPHLDLLLVPANPTSFFASPTGFTATAIAAGAALYPTHCAICHGADGRGDGPAAAALAEPPADLTAEHLWMHSDGELFWWLSHGIEGPDGALVMPGFATRLSEDERWSLIDAIRARNAGLRREEAGDWSPPLPAPALTATCPDGGERALTALRGRVVRLVFPAAASPPRVDDAGAGCVALDPAVPIAYAIALGVADAMAWRGRAC